MSRDLPSDPILRQAVSRRTVLAGAAALALVARPSAVGARSTSTVDRQPVAMPSILPRSSWDAGVGATGPLEAEDVRFLLVHHTAEPGNDYGEDDVVGLLQGIFGFHTGPDKGWPDIAYNFMIDRFGRIYEARTGSIDGPIRGSATGGNQGYAQLCCFLGDFASVPPTPAAQASMIDLLTWLADRYRVPVGSGSSIEFTSLGSNRWPAGQAVRVDPIAAHRDVSETTCPGDACMELVRATFPAEVSSRLASAVTTTTTAAATNTTAASPSDAPVDTSAGPAEGLPPDTSTDGPGLARVAAAGAVVAGSAVAAVEVLRRRRSDRAAPDT